MNRRQALGLSAAAIFALTVGSSCWKKSDVSEGLTFDTQELEILSAAVDAIIPGGSTPGAKEVGVHTYIAKMIQDCFDAETQKSFKAGLQHLSKKNFAQAEDKLELLKNFDGEEGFIDLLKNLTVRGYQTSEYFMMQVQKFEFIPGRYIGCTSLS